MQPALGVGFLAINCSPSCMCTPACEAGSVASPTACAGGSKSSSCISCSSLALSQQLPPTAYLSVCLPAARLVLACLWCCAMHVFAMLCSWYHVPQHCCWLPLCRAGMTPGPSVTSLRRRPLRWRCCQHVSRRQAELFCSCVHHVFGYSTCWQQQQQPIQHHHPAYNSSAGPQPELSVMLAAALLSCKLTARLSLCR
jgi:hypothetical protein